MASDHHDYQPGQMDISEHLKSWHGFTAFTKWSLIGILLFCLRNISPALAITRYLAPFIGIGIVAGSNSEWNLE